MEFDRYLLGELLWELDKFSVQIPGLTDVPPEQIEVLSHSGYDAVRLRAHLMLFDARLDWSAKSAPHVVITADEPTGQPREPAYRAER
jgi:hypothetical protein